MIKTQIIKMHFDKNNKKHKNEQLRRNKLTKLKLKANKVI